MDLKFYFIALMKNLLSITKFILASIIGLLAPIKSIILILFFIVFVDFGLALYNAFKKGIPITSRRMYKTIPKLLIYVLVMFITYYSNLLIFHSDIELHKFVAGFIVLTEIKSIDENIKLIIGYSIFDEMLELLGRGDVNNSKKQLNDKEIMDENIG